MMGDAMRNRRIPLVLILPLAWLCCGVLQAQRPPSNISYGSKVPTDVKAMYERGLEYLAG